MKKLRLVKRTISSLTTSSLTLINNLEECKTSKEVLKVLLLLTDSEFDISDLFEIVRKLCEHFKSEVDSTVRVKILSLLCDIGHEQGIDIFTIIDEIILLLKNDKSHKVIAQGMNSILKLGQLISDTATTFHQKLVDVAKTYLKDTNHAVKCKCLEIIGIHSPICKGEEAESLLKLVHSYFKHDDARVRSQAISTFIILNERGFKVNPNVYVDLCETLKDDYEIVRKVALQLIWKLANTYPNK